MCKFKSLNFKNDYIMNTTTLLEIKYILKRKNTKIKKNKIYF